jgi:hypothetical protein
LLSLQPVLGSAIDAVKLSGNGDNGVRQIGGSGDAAVTLSKPFGVKVGVGASLAQTDRSLAIAGDKVSDFTPSAIDTGTGMSASV